MMDDQFFFSTSSSLFDTYLVYGIIGLLIFIAVLGLIVLLATSCCCCYCCSSSRLCCFCCNYNRRHSSYKLRQQSKYSDGLGNGDSKTAAFLRRHPSDVADFSHLYDSCPHLINSKAMTTMSSNMDTSCTTIDTLVSPISPCSSFCSFMTSGTSTNDTKGKLHAERPTKVFFSFFFYYCFTFQLAPNVQNNLNNLSRENNINIDKTNHAPSLAVKGKRQNQI